MHTIAKHAAIFQALLIAAMLLPAANAQSPKQSESQDSAHNQKTKQAEVAEAASGALQVEVVDPPTLDNERQAVLDALKKLLQDLAHRNLEAISSCLSENVTQINDTKVMFGKPEVMENVKKNVIGTKNESPVKRLVVYRPFICVKGDTAMVSFRATKEMAGSHPVTLESWCSEVFERKDGQWLVLQLKTNWKPIASKK